MHTSSCHRQLTCLVMILICWSANAWPQWNDYIYGIHDYNSSVGDILTLNSQARGWVLVLQSLNGYTGGVNSEVQQAAQRGLGVVVRMHWGYGADGSLPAESSFSTYAQRAATYCQTHQSWCHYYIVGNETNLCGEWPGWGTLDGSCDGSGCAPNHQKTTQQRYATCFQQTYSAVHAVAPNVKLLLSPAATWAGEFVCANNGFDTIDFICYTTTLYSLIPHSMIGGMAFHPKTHVHDPSEITNNTLHDQKVFGCGHNENVHWYFRVYQDELNHIPTDLRNRPIFFTELNPHEPSYGGWQNVDNGYCVAAFEECNNWNATHSDRKITGMMLYRWDDGVDVWDIWNKGNVHNDLRNAMAMGRKNPGESWYSQPIATDTPTRTPTPAATATPLPVNWIIVDDQDAGFAKNGFTGTGTYDDSTAGASYRNHFWYCKNEATVVSWWGKWTPAGLAAGNYEVRINVPSNHSNTCAAKYEIHHNGQTDIVTICQNNYFSGSWPSLGAFYFSGAGSEFIYLGDATGETAYAKYLGWDAVAFVPVGGSTATPTRTPTAPIPPPATYTNTPTRTPTSFTPTAIRTPTGTATKTATPTVPVSPTSGVTCQGDANHDLFVNGDDFRSVRDNFGVGGCGHIGDANGDCFVNGDDFRVVRDNFGRGCP